MELVPKKDGNFNNVTNEEFSKQKSRDNNHPEPHPGQFDLLRNASPNWAPTWSCDTFSFYALVSL